MDKITITIKFGQSPIDILKESQKTYPKLYFWLIDDQIVWEDNVQKIIEKIHDYKISSLCQLDGCWHFVGNIDRYDNLKGDSIVIFLSKKIKDYLDSLPRLIQNPKH